MVDSNTSQEDHFQFLNDSVDRMLKRLSKDSQDISNLYSQTKLTPDGKYKNYIKYMNQFIEG